MFTHENCFELGSITRPHGYAGEVLLFLDTDNPQHYKKLKSLLVELNGQLVPYFVKNIQVLNNNSAIVKLEDVTDLALAEHLVHCKVFLPLEQLPKLKKGEYYLHQVIGFEVIDEEQGSIGTIIQLFEAKGQDMFGIDHKGVEILMPKTDAFIKKVDMDARQMHVLLPEGYIEVFTSDK